MKNYMAIIQFVISLFYLRLNAFSHDVILKNSTIIHPETGLFLDYVGLYIPSETIIHTSAIFPMTAATCHFLPLSAAQNIPSCNITKNNITKKKRAKRLVDVISLGVGSVALGMSISNSIQIENLQQQVAIVENSLSKLSESLEITGAHLAKVSSRQIELTEQLQVTQKALNDMIPILDSHAEAINTIKTSVETLNIRYQHSFLYLAITQIYRNELTLSFLSPADVHKLVYTIIKEGNLTLDSYPGSLPIVQIITRLLVRQQIDFVPRTEYMINNLDDYDDPNEIGRLVITSYFAVPTQKQSIFYTYKLMTIPFYHENETIELNNIPRYWAINPTDKTTMEWYNPEESGCDFRFMVSCRDTPPIFDLSIHSCLDQIMQMGTLTKCKISSVPAAKFFIRQLKNNFWITSAAESIQCMKIPRTQYHKDINHVWNINEKTIIPPLSVVNVTEGYVIACPGFTLIGNPVPTPNASLVILNGGGLLTKNISIVNVHQYITKNITLYKNNLVEQDRKLLLEFLSNRPKAISTNHNPLLSYLRSFGISFSTMMVFMLVFVLLYYVPRCKRGDRITHC